MSWKDEVHEKLAEMEKRFDLIEQRLRALEDIMQSYGLMGAVAVEDEDGIVIRPAPIGGGGETTQGE